MIAPGATSDSHQDIAAPRRSRRRPAGWVQWLLGIALLAVVIVAALRFAEAREFARIAEHAEPWWVALAVVFQVSTYLAAGQVFRAVAAAAGCSLTLGTTSRLSLTKLFVDQAVPTGGLSGTAVLANGLEQRGIPRPVVASSVVVDLVSYYFAYLFSLALALAIAMLRREMSAILLIVALVFALFGIGLSTTLLALSGRRTRVPRRLARFRSLRTGIEFIQQADPQLARKLRLLLQASMYQFALILCDAATVFVLVRSLGAHGSPSGVFASFMISDLLRIVGFMPGGLGTFEAASVVTLRMVGVPTAVALAATLLFRGLSFWLPMLPGVWLSRREMRRSSRGVG